MTTCVVLVVALAGTAEAGSATAASTEVLMAEAAAVVGDKAVVGLVLVAVMLLLLIEMELPRGETVLCFLVRVLPPRATSE